MRWARARWRPLVAWAAAVPAALWALFRIAGWDTWYPTTQLMAFTPYVAGLSLLGLLATVLCRRWDAAIVAGVAAIALAACVLPRAIPDGGPKFDGAPLRVLTANLRVGGGDAETLRRIVRDENVDVVALQEVTPEFVARAGDLLPYHVVHAESGVGGSAIYARFPLVDNGERRTLFFGQARAARASAAGFALEVESVHTVAPSEAARVPGWRESFAKQPPATVDGAFRILAGDFNATLDHSLMRALIDTGYRDAADAVGAGLVGTWGPYDGDPIPPVTLDHVLVDKRLGVVSVRAFVIPNSDHRALLAVLTVPKG